MSYTGISLVRLNKIRQSSNWKKKEQAWLESPTPFIRFQKQIKRSLKKNLTVILI